MASTTNVVVEKARTDKVVTGGAPATPPRVATHKKAIILIVVLVLVGSLVAAYIRISPFARQAVIQDLQDASGSTVTIRSYRRTHFPAPGCVLEGVEFHKAENKYTFLSIDKLVIKGTYLGVLRHHVQRIKAVGARVIVPPFGSNLTFQTQHSNIVIDEVVADGTIVEFANEDSKEKPLQFEVHKGLIQDVRWGAPLQYKLEFHNPNPPGEISVQGKFGAWTTGHPGDTPISGDYTFEHADLSVYGGIRGFLSSKGKFEGILQHINVMGDTDTPDFEVEAGGHKVKLTSKFDAYVDGIRGDTYLKRVEGHLGRTTIIADGSIASSPNHPGKSAEIELTTRRGRIEDLLGLFVSAPRSPMSGEVSLGTKAEIPPGDQGFLRKVKLDGAFGIDAGKFSNTDTQKDVDTLSAGARGENKDDPETVMTDLKGSVTLVGGLAHFSDLSFTIPGAHARMQGAYDLISHKIDLHGKLRVDTRISKTSTGFKSLLLKMMDPIFKKKNKGEIVPVHIAGTYEKPEFGLDLTQPSTKNAAPQK
jgi:AsmA-like C-terminal region